MSFFSLHFLGDIFLRHYVHQLSRCLCLSPPCLSRSCLAFDPPSCPHGPPLQQPSALLNPTGTQHVLCSVVAFSAIPSAGSVPRFPALRDSTVSFGDSTVHWLLPSSSLSDWPLPCGAWLGPPIFIIHFRWASTTLLDSKTAARWAVDSSPANVNNSSSASPRTNVCPTAAPTRGIMQALKCCVQRAAHDFLLQVGSSYSLSSSLSRLCTF